MSKSLLAADCCQSAVPVLPTEVVRGWRFTATCRVWPGLLVGSTPCFRVARPLQGRRTPLGLSAAPRSRSMTKPQASQVKIRSARLSVGFTVPQPEHVLLEGNHRSATASCPLFHPVL